MSRSLKFSAPDQSLHTARAQYEAAIGSNEQVLFEDPRQRIQPAPVEVHQVVASRFGRRHEPLPPGHYFTASGGIVNLISASAPNALNGV
jgi:hypothetical protein